MALTGESIVLNADPERREEQMIDIHYLNFHLKGLG